VGYYRSHTRDGLALAPEDVELMDRYFPAASNIALVIKPFATKASQAGLFFRQGGVFPESSPLEFPFRVREMTGDESAPRISMAERRPRGLATPVAEDSYEDYRTAPDPMPAPEAALPKPKSGWVWIPLSFIFLLLGLLLGFGAALTMSPKSNVHSPADFAIGLSVTKSGSNLSVKWDRQSPVVRAALRGLLEIEDSGHIKPVDLDAATLRSGTIIVQNPSSTVRFKLTVYPSEQVSVMETVVWKNSSQ
jgi:hypothetical protein